MKRYQVTTFADWNTPIRAFEENGTKKIYFWLADLARAADNTTIANWGSLKLIPTIRISPRECEPAPSNRSMVAVLWDDFKKAASNIAMSPYSSARIQALISHYDPICKDYAATHTQPQEIEQQETEPQPNVDEFVKRMYELIEENKELKAKVSTLETKLSEYEAIKDMFMGL